MRDRLLRSTIGPLAASLVASGTCDGWFFVRYADPDPHIRVRWHGEPDRLLAVVPALRLRLQELVDSRFVSRVEFATYERETERYGGDEGVILAERVFEIDSQAVVDILRNLPHDHDGATRAEFAVLTAYRLFRDFGLTDDDSEILSERAAQQRCLETGVSSHRLWKTVHMVLRTRRERFSLMMTDPLKVIGPEVLDILDRRSEALRVVAPRVKTALNESWSAFPNWLLNVLHMHFNRLLLAEESRQECVIYGLLHCCLRMSRQRSARLRGSERDEVFRKS